MKDSAVRHFRRPRRVEADEGDRELAAIVANVPGAVYRCALDRNWTMEAFRSEIERISSYRDRIRFLVRRDIPHKLDLAWIQGWRRRESNPRPRAHDESVYKRSPGLNFARRLPPDGPPHELAPL